MPPNAIEIPTIHELQNPADRRFSFPQIYYAVIKNIENPDLTYQAMRMILDSNPDLSYEQIKALQSKLHDIATRNPAIRDNKKGQRDIHELTENHFQEAMEKKRRIAALSGTPTYICELMASSPGYKGDYISFILSLGDNEEADILCTYYCGSQKHFAMMMTVITHCVSHKTKIEVAGNLAQGRLELLYLEHPRFGTLGL